MIRGKDWHSIDMNCWYRDENGVLLMDPEPIPATEGFPSGGFRLYRGGIAPRDYTPFGLFVREIGTKGEAIGAVEPGEGNSRNLLFQIEREAPPAPPEAPETVFPGDLPTPPDAETFTTEETFK